MLKPTGSHESCFQFYGASLHQPWPWTHQSQSYSDYGDLSLRLCCMARKRGIWWWASTRSWCIIQGCHAILQAHFEEHRKIKQASVQMLAGYTLAAMKWFRVILGLDVMACLLLSVQMSNTMLPFIISKIVAQRCNWEQTDCQKKLPFKLAIFENSAACVKEVCTTCHALLTCFLRRQQCMTGQYLESSPDPG